MTPATPATPATTSSTSPKKLLLATGGGDCPGLNAVIRAVVKHARIHYGWEVIGSEDAFNGILDVPHRIVDLDLPRVRGLLGRGGTILGTTNRGDPFAFPVPDGKGGIVLEDRSDEIIQFCRHQRVDCLVSIGGDGTQEIALKLFEKGLNVVAVPKTIDNDLACTDYSFGFLTAVQTATDAVDKLQSTAESHDRVIVLEVMGRDAGWIALASGIAGGADVILVPEIPFDIDAVNQRLLARIRTGKHFAVVVAAEGSYPKGGDRITREQKVPGRGKVLLGGVGVYVAERIAEGTGLETRCTVLGHLQRGGSPSAFDRILASEYGVFAVELVRQGKFGHMVSFRTPQMTSFPLSEVVKQYKKVELEGSMMQTARMLNICVGD